MSKSWHEIMHDGQSVYGFGTLEEAEVYCAWLGASTGTTAEHYPVADWYVRSNRIGIAQNGGFDLQSAVAAVEAVRAV